MADSIGFPREFNGSDWLTVIKDPTDALRVLFYNRLKASTCFQRTLEHVVYLRGCGTCHERGARNHRTVLILVTFGSRAALLHRICMVNHNFQI
jgi:hypothetical protein